MFFWINLKDYCACLAYGNLLSFYPKLWQHENACPYDPLNTCFSGFSPYSRFIHKSKNCSLTEKFPFSLVKMPEAINCRAAYWLALADANWWRAINACEVIPLTSPSRASRHMVCQDCQDIGISPQV